MPDQGLARVLIVEDEEFQREGLKLELEAITGRGRVAAVGNYDDAISAVNPQIFLYILDGSFPRSAGGREQPLGIELARAIHDRGVNYDKIVVMSANPDTLNAARELGISKLYSKGMPDEDAGERNLDDLAEDLRPLLTT